jgi:hypothetical protein
MYLSRTSVVGKQRTDRDLKTATTTLTLERGTYIPTISDVAANTDHIPHVQGQAGCKTWTSLQYNRLLSISRRITTGDYFLDDTAWMLLSVAEGFIL